MRVIPTAILSAALLALGSGCRLVSDVDPATAEAAIWALEESYWEANRGADYEAIVATWHDRFLGWPASEAKPIDKEEGKRYVRREFTEPASYDFEIEPGGVRITGDVAVNYYTVRFTSTDAEGEEHTDAMRIVHAWLRDGDTWKVLGGMSSRP